MNSRDKKRRQANIRQARYHARKRIDALSKSSQESTAESAPQPAESQEDDAPQQVESQPMETLENVTHSDQEDDQQDDQIDQISSSSDSELRFCLYDAPDDLDPAHEDKREKDKEDLQTNLAVFFQEAGVSRNNADRLLGILNNFKNGLLDLPSSSKTLVQRCLKSKADTRFQIEEDGLVYIGIEFCLVRLLERFGDLFTENTISLTINFDGVCLASELNYF